MTETAKNEKLTRKLEELLLELLEYAPEPYAPEPESINEVRNEVRELLAAGADPSEAALVRAVDTGDSELVRLLLDHGADPNACEADEWSGWTALGTAVRNGDSELVRMLLEAGAVPEAGGYSTSEDGDVPALWAAVANLDEEIVRLLLAHGADPREAVPYGHEEEYESVLEMAEGMEEDRIFRWRQHNAVVQMLRDAMGKAEA